MTPMPRTAVSLYVALAFHALLLLGLALSPPSQNSAGPGLGLSLPGAGLSASERQAAMALPVHFAESPARPALVVAAPPTSERSKAATSPAPRRAAPPEPTTERAVEASKEGSAASSAAAARGAAQSGGGGSNAYYARLRAHLAGFRHTLPAGLGSARARVRFQVSADGWISDLALEESSGIAVLDTEALDLLRRAAPLPRPPGGRELRLVVPVSIAGPG